MTQKLGMRGGEKNAPQTSREPVAARLTDTRDVTFKMILTRAIRILAPLRPPADSPIPVEGRARGAIERRERERWQRSYRAGWRGIHLERTGHDAHVSPRDRALVHVTTTIRGIRR